MDVFWVEHDTGLILFAGTKAECITYITNHPKPAALCITDHTGRRSAGAPDGDEDQAERGYGLPYPAR